MPRIFDGIMIKYNKWATFVHAYYMLHANCLTSAYTLTFLPGNERILQIDIIAQSSFRILDHIANEIFD